MRFYKWMVEYSGWISIGILLIYLSPYFVLGKDAYICLYDILEYLPMYKIVVSKLEYLLGHNYEMIPNVMNGLHRVSFPSEMNVQVWLYYFFEPFTAYVINAVIIHIVAFLSARIFLVEQIVKRNFFDLSHLSDKEVMTIINFSALYFALIPFWTFGGLSIAGMPLLVNAFLNILIDNKTKWRDILIIILFPFYSYFIFSNVFVIFFMFILYVFYVIKFKKLQWKFLVVFILFVTLSVFTEYRIILSTLDGYAHHRIFFQNRAINHSISSIINSILNNYEFYFYSYSDAVSRHYPFLFLLTLFTILMSFLLYNKKSFVYLLVLLISTIIFAYLYVLGEYVLVVLKNIMPSFLFKLAQGFTFRFYVLNPFLWLIITFIIGIFMSSINLRAKKIIIGLLLMFNIYLLFSVGKVLGFTTYRALESPFANNIKNKNIPITYRSYFDVDLFEKINLFIQQNFNLQKHQYRVAALTDPNPAYPLFSPAVLQFNDFYTIDGYCVYYTHQYKQTFEKIINKELEKNPSFYSFKTYGNRVYICSADTTKDGKIKSLDLNYKILKDLNCKFLFSRKEILNADSHLVYVKHFDGIYWKINLYEIK